MLPRVENCLHSINFLSCIFFILAHTACRRHVDTRVCRELLQLCIFHFFFSKLSFKYYIGLLFS